MGDAGTVERIILKWTLNIYVEKVSSGFIWLTTGPSGGIL